MVMVEPCCPEEVAPLFGWCLEHDGPSFLRMASMPYLTEAAPPKGHKFEKGRGYEVRQGKHGALMAAGLLGVSEALQAAKILSKQGLAFAVIANPWLNVVDRAWLGEIATRFPLLVTIDNHYRAGGQGQMILAEIAALNGAQPRCLSLGLDKVPPSGRNEEVLDAIGLDGASIAKRVAEFGGGP